MTALSRIPKPSDNVALRPLQAQDAQAAAEVIRAAFAAQRMATRSRSSALGETRETVAAKIEAGGGFGVFAGQKLAAVALWRLDDSVFLVSRVGVLPQQRGQGIAGVLFASRDAEARRRGVNRMRSRARLNLPENERVFARFGFQRARVEAHEGFDLPTTAVMEKTLR